MGLERRAQKEKGLFLEEKFNFEVIIENELRISRSNLLKYLKYTRSKKREEEERPILNFTNVLRAAFTHADP